MPRKEKDNNTDFRSEFRHLMYTSGDHSSPGSQTTDYVQERVHTLMFTMLSLMSRLVRERQNSGSVGRGEKISLQDVITVMLQSPHRKKKIGRLIYSFGVMDISSKAYSSSSSDLSPENLLEDKPRISELKRILEGNISQFEEYFQPSFIDEITQQRQKSLDKRTEKMDSKEYVEFAKCRLSNFRKSWPHNFRAWIQTPPLLTRLNCDTSSNDSTTKPISISLLALEALHHIALESVSLLVEGALAIKRQDHLAKAKMMEFDPGTVGDKVSSILAGLQNIPGGNSTTKFIERRFYNQVLDELKDKQKPLFYLYLCTS